MKNPKFRPSILIKVLSNVEPYGLRWRPEKERQLAKIRVLRDDDVVVLNGVLPNLAIRR